MRYIVHVGGAFVHELECELGRLLLSGVTALITYIMRRVHLLLPQLEVVLVLLAPLLTTIERMSDRPEI